MLALPGRRAGRPARPDHLSARLGEIGVPLAAARSDAIRQQLLGLSSRTPSATTTRPPAASSERAAGPGADARRQPPTSPSGGWTPHRLTDS
ncbi:hypothetical protein ACFQ0M_49695 [Kitasatospora aburaviensis]